MIGLMDPDNDAAQIAGEFPGWEAWQGIDRLWHARIRGATPPVMVHGEDLVDLRDQIILQQRRAEEEDWRRHRSDERGSPAEGRS
jgi:hypothetical protein